MQNDLKLEVHNVTKEMWDALLYVFVGTFATRLLQMEMGFDSYKWIQNTQ